MNCTLFEIKTGMRHAVYRPNTENVFTSLVAVQIWTHEHISSVPLSSGRSPEQGGDRELFAARLAKSPAIHTYPASDWLPCPTTSEVSFLDLSKTSEYLSAAAAAATS